MDNSLPRIAVKHSIKVQVEKGKTYCYCTCGLSKNQPFCDSSHIGTEFLPIEFTAIEDGIISFCGCKYTKIPPFCDGTHRALT